MPYDEEKELRHASELLEAARVLEQLQRIDLDKIERAAGTDMDRLVEDLKNSKSVARKVAKPRKQVARKKMSWRQRRKKKREYYQSVDKYRRLELRGELLSAGSEGWWEYITRIWKRHKVPYTLTFEEWDTHVWPQLDGRVPIMRRYQPNKPFSLDNLLVTESGNEKVVLFDGKEHVLRAAGYIL